MRTLPQRLRATTHVPISLWPDGLQTGYPHAVDTQNGHLAGTSERADEGNRTPVFSLGISKKGPVSRSVSESSQLTCHCVSAAISRKRRVPFRCGTDLARPFLAHFSNPWRSAVQGEYGGRKVDASATTQICSLSTLEGPLHRRLGFDSSPWFDTMSPCTGRPGCGTGSGTAAAGPAGSPISQPPATRLVARRGQRPHDGRPRRTSSPSSA